MKPLRPVFDQIRLAWLRFLRDSQNPMSPYLHRTVIRINAIERRQR